MTEWLFVPVYCFIGYKGWSPLAWSFQIAFLILGSMFQYFTVTSPAFEATLRPETSAGGLDEKTWQERTKGVTCPQFPWRTGSEDSAEVAELWRLKHVGPSAKNKIFEAMYKDDATELGYIPVGWLAGCNLNAWLIGKAPNFISIISTAVAVGIMHKEWDESVQRTWRLRWTEFDDHLARFAPLHDITGNVGDFVMPHVLTAVLLLAFVLHMSFMMLCLVEWDVKGVAECANLLLVDKMLTREKCGTLRPWFVGIKTVMLWAKVSLFGILYDKLQFGGEASVVLAIVLGFYGSAPLPKTLVQSLIAKECWQSVLLVGANAILVIIVLHFFGAFVCPSHDFSILHAGCTEMYHVNI